MAAETVANELGLLVTVNDGQFQFELADPKGFARSISRDSFAILRLQASPAAGQFQSDLAWPFQNQDLLLNPDFPKLIGKHGPKSHFKKQGWKQRTQLQVPKSAVARLAQSLKEPSSCEHEQLFRLLLGMKELSFTCLKALLAQQKIGLDEFLTASKGFDSSVLNLYQYFGAEDVDFDCRAHADPGLLSVLTRSTRPGLEITPPMRERTEGEEAMIWQAIEPAMSSDGSSLLIIAGETLQRVTQSRIPECIHRVVREPSVERTNLVFELRPTKAIWVWPTS